MANKSYQVDMSFQSEFVLEANNQEDRLSTPGAPWKIDVKCERKFFTDNADRLWLSKRRVYLIYEGG